MNDASILRASSNGTTVRKPASNKPRQARSAAVPGISGARKGITVALGCGIPLLSLALSRLGGQAIQVSHYWIGAATLGLCCTVLGVSLSHLAWAVRDITRSAWWQSWCLAVAVDLSLVVCELMGVSGAADTWVRTAVMSAVTVFSMALNCWAFLRPK